MFAELLEIFGGGGRTGGPGGLKRRINYPPEDGAAGRSGFWAVIKRPFVPLWATSGGGGRTGAALALAALGCYGESQREERS